MTKTILDTSSLIALALAQRDTRTPIESIRDMWRAHGGIDGAIEALILHETIIFDGPSLRRNATRLPELTRLSALGTSLWEEDTTLERRIYSSLLADYVPRIRDAGPHVVNLFRMHTEQWMAMEIGADRYYPSAGWRDIQSELTAEAEKLAQSLRERFGTNTPMSGAACALLLRTLYYDRLQQLASANLILHPLKGQFFADDNLQAEQVRAKSADSWDAARILSIFDDTVRRAFYQRKEKWLGRPDLQYEIPMLTSFVLTKCKSWKDLISVVEGVRESKHARRFREAVAQLLAAARERRNQEVDEILSQLSAASDEWARKLKGERLTKKVRVSVPFINVGTDIDLPDVKLRSGPGDNLLVFLHSLVSGS